MLHLNHSKVLPAYLVGQIGISSRSLAGQACGPRRAQPEPRSPARASLLRLLLPLPLQQQLLLLLLLLLLLRLLRLLTTNNNDNSHDNHDNNDNNCNIIIIIISGRARAARPPTCGGKRSLWRSSLTSLAPALYPFLQRQCQKRQSRTECPQVTNNNAVVRARLQTARLPSNSPKHFQKLSVFLGRKDDSVHHHPFLNISISQTWFRLRCY